MDVKTSLETLESANALEVNDIMIMMTVDILYMLT